jgi:hypothetical protein
LFALPYAVDRPISVALHNMGGTLLLDMDPGDARIVHKKNLSSDSSSTSTLPNRELKDTNNEMNRPGSDDVTRSLVSLSMDSSVAITHSEALTVVNSIIHTFENVSQHDKATSLILPHDADSATGLLEHQTKDFLELPESYAAQYIPPAPEPREYLTWKFHGMNLLVGSDALIYRSPASSTPSQSGNQSSSSLTVRVEDAAHMQAVLGQHQAMVKSGTFVADRQLAKLQQIGKPSYAETVAQSKIVVSVSGDAKGSRGEHKCEKAKKRDLLTVTTVVDKESPPPQSSGRTFAAPDLDKVQLQTCIVPMSVEPLSVGNLLSPNNVTTPDAFVRHDDGPTPERGGAPLSPVSTVLDTYLDNIMANVPQLALCLREKGFIQSVKLLDTHEIPSRLMQASTLDTTIPFETIRGNDNDPADQVFSPQIMEMNAQALLRFLKTNCNKDNATYLLRRDAGMANIQLYDISSISAQRQQKWVWWLAMISYRFSHRLRHLSLQAVSGAVLRRTFRVRQRSLLHNTLDLLETLSDMNGNKHESLIAAVNENLADTFLVIGGEDDDSDIAPNSVQTTQAASPIIPPPQAVSSHQPYGCISVDALGKAQDHLMYGIKILGAVLDQNLKERRQLFSERDEYPKGDDEGYGVISVSPNDSSDSDASDSDDELEQSDLNTAPGDQIDPVVTQLYGMHHKLVNVSLRLTEIHLKNYRSSSAMQTLRTAAHRIADSLFLAQLIDHQKDVDIAKWLPKIQLQYTWLWEQCGHFARSFAADRHWRDRGHASGDDVINSLQEVESAFTERKGLNSVGPLSFHHFTRPMESLTSKSNGTVSLQSLSGIVVVVRPTGKRHGKSDPSPPGLNATKYLLDHRKMMQRDERRVLVAAVIAYSRSVNALEDYLQSEEAPFDKALLDLLRQRLGDACNETGKVMLNELRSLLGSVGGQTNDEKELSASIADVLCNSAEFWFSEGLHSFEVCRDLRNLALLRCNLCQCYKLKANAIFAKTDSKSEDDSSHAEDCLQEAANQLQAAHEALEVRDTDPVTWDMVSGELAATFLVLGVRRRQSLIGSGSNLKVLQELRLSSGKERSIVEPMEKALTTYEKMGNLRQAAAAHYQLAQFYSKTWTCQRDEPTTRKKLSSAFTHYHSAYAYFARAVRGDEATLCLICLDLSSLYSTVPGEECLMKALLCCLDSSAAFTPLSVEAASNDMSTRTDWFVKIDTLAQSAEEQTFKQLKNLAKFEAPTQMMPNQKLKDLYRAGLTAKMKYANAKFPTDSTMGEEELDAKANRIVAVHCVLESIKDYLMQRFP